VRVAVRCRPLSKNEISRGSQPIVEIVGPTELVIAPPVETARRGEEKFTFDHVYGADSTQDQVFGDIGIGLVTRTLDGFNSTLFAYGQTGSGKTFTMMGDETSDPFSASPGIDGKKSESNPLSGVIPRVTIELFDQVDKALAMEREASTHEDIEIQVTISYLEIYNEDIHDLLNPKDSGSLKIREHPEEGIYVENLCQLVVGAATDVGRLVGQGNSIRAVAATQMNERSSRSHSVLTMAVQQRKTEQIEEMTRQSLLGAKLNLVDLAGSERVSKTGVQGQQLKEGAAINTSLMALGSVINALSEGKYVNYRNSKLTRLLQESLGGNASTVMLAAISPADYNYDETMSTIRYAQRAKKITNKVSRNEDVHEKMVRELQEEIERLKAQLEQQADVAGGPAQSEANLSEREKIELEQKLADLEKKNEDTWQQRMRERERLTQELEAERQANLGRALGDIIGDVKQRKLQTLQKINVQQQRRATLSKDVKRLKQDLNKYTALVNKRAEEYEQVQKERETLLSLGLPGTDALADELAQRFLAIEQADSAQKEAKRSIKSVNLEIQQVDRLIQDLKADLVASSALLQDNDRIRKRIQEEEMAKWAKEKEQLLAREKEELREQAKSLAAANVQAAQQKAAATAVELDQVRKKLEVSEGELETTKQSNSGKEKFRSALVKIDKLRIARLKEELREAKETATIRAMELEQGRQEAELLNKRMALLETENRSLLDSVEISQLETRELRHEAEEVRRQQQDSMQALADAESEISELTQALQVERAAKTLMELELREVRQTMDQLESERTAIEFDHAIADGSHFEPLAAAPSGGGLGVGGGGDMSVGDGGKTSSTPDQGAGEDGDADEDYEDDEFLTEAMAVVLMEADGEQQAPDPHLDEQSPVDARTLANSPFEAPRQHQAEDHHATAHLPTPGGSSKLSDKAQKIANEKIHDIIAQHQAEQQALTRRLAAQKQQQRDKLKAKLDAKRSARKAEMERLRLDEETKKAGRGGVDCGR